MLDCEFLMASDEKILDELHFLSWKIEALERKLETSLAIQEDLAANLLPEDGSSAASVTAIKKCGRRHVSGSSCSEPISSDDEHNSSRLDSAISKDSEHELERSTSYLIIPVGSYKGNDSYSFTTEKQTFIWSEMDDTARKYITCEDAFIGDNDGATENKINANQRDLSIPSVTNSLKSFANEVIPLPSQSSFGTSEKQMCTQRNERVSEIIPSEDCLLNSRGSHSNAYDPFEGKREVGGAIDIEYDQEEKMVSTECKDYKLPLSRKYGLTIGIATAKEPSQGISSSGVNSFKPIARHHSERFQSHFAADEIKEQRAVDEQLRSLFKQSTTQSTHSSDGATFDQIYHHSSESMHCDNEKYMEYKQSSSDFKPDISAYYTEKAGEPSYNVIYVDSEPLEGDHTNYDFVDTLGEREAFYYERNPAKLNANLSDAFEQSSSTNTEPDRQQAMADYPLLVKNGKYENVVYFTRQVEQYQNGNHGLKQNETMNCDAVASNKLIEMQMNHVPEEQRYEHAYYTRKRFDAKSLLTNNGTGYTDGNESGQHIQNVPADVNNNGEAVKAVLFRVDKTKPQYQEADGHISQFNDQFFGIVGYNNDYKAISTDSNDRVATRTTRSKSHPVHPSYHQIMRNLHAPKRGPHTHHSREDAFENHPEKRVPNDNTHSKFHFHSREDEFENHLEKRIPHDNTHSKFPFEADALTESGFSETLMSALSDDVFFDSTPNPDLVSQTPSGNVITTNHDAAPEVSGSESSYSSLTSISSNNGGIYPWKIRKDSLSRQDYNERKQFVIPDYEHSALERNSRPSSTSSYFRDNEPSSDSEPYVRSFRLSPLPRPARAPSLHEQLMGDILRREYTTGQIRVSSPTSSVDTSDLSTSDRVCECQYQCECQTGIPTAEDFREELKAISTYVLNARKESASLYKKPQVKYYLDEEQGDMDIFGGCLQKKENKTVPMLVRVILRLRKHFFGTLDSKTPFEEKSESDVNNNERISLEKLEEQTFNRKQRGRQISFSPSAMLLSAIGENSAAEVKEVIEKERIDVNQLSPSGRSLLHKAAAAGDLESIHTLIQYGALVNIVDQDGFPPIHSALKKAHYKCAILLIECGTDIARYTTERIREFMEIRDMTTGHFPVLLKTNL